MSRAVRAFLVWAMVIAMPVQGLAASLMLLCGPGHMRVAPSLVTHGAPEAGPAAMAPSTAHRHAHDPAADGHAHAVPGDAPHAHAMPVDAPHAHVVAHRHDGDGVQHTDPAPQHGKHSCSACAACCAMLALPVSVSQPGAVAPAHPTPASSAVVVPSLPPDGLERPPRAFLA